MTKEWALRNTANSMITVTQTGKGQTRAEHLFIIEAVAIRNIYKAYTSHPRLALAKMHKFIIKW